MAPIGHVITILNRPNATVTVSSVALVLTISLHLLPSPSISLHLPPSPFISFHLPPSPFIPSISLHLPSSPSISLHLPSPPFTSPMCMQVALVLTIFLNTQLGPTLHDAPHLLALSPARWATASICMVCIRAQPYSRDRYVLSACIRPLYI